MSPQNRMAVNIDEQISEAGKNAGGVIAVADVKSLVDGLFESALAEARAENQVLVKELEELVSYIGNTKGEVLSLQPRSLSTKEIPGANEELDAIIGATDEAVGRIMDAADQVGEIAGGLKGKTAEALQNISTELYEASSFQDICGQRITKVVKTLKFLEERLIVLADAVGDHHVEAGDAEIVYNEDGLVDDVETLLHGPQLESKASTQDEIDALMAKLD